ncbi:unnamed protein product [Somion occarium]|uniref:MYND-type domain-containing protein n=1 Tax=Somion occarium TaxID=3059160 RepID=A0ABP1DM33_9APHY
MPGPGKKKQKSLPKKPTSSNSVRGDQLDSFFNDIDSTGGWKDVVMFLCDYFQLPDMNRRSGLKKVHVNFPQIYRKLDDAFAQAKTLGNDKVMGGIVCIWAKMSVDARLRNKLFKEGLLSKLIPLLDMRSTRIVGLQALVTMTHHGGIEVREDIAKETPTLLRLMQEFPDDAKVNELVVSTISHATGSLINTDISIPARVKKAIDMPTLLKLIVDAMRKPTAEYYLINHGMNFFMSASMHYAREMKAIPPLMNLLVAALRSNDLSIRSDAVITLLRINIPDSEEDTRFSDPHKFMASISRPSPSHLNAACMQYGATKVETYLRTQTMRDYQKAMMECAQNHDLVKLGRTLADLITRTEYSVAEGGYQAVNERTGRMELMDVGLPFKMWSDALPHCAKALRAKGELDKADILDIKYWILKQNIPKATAHAEKSLERNPNVAYFYYAIGLSADSTQALRAVKKGLKAKQTTPFVRYYLLWRAVEHAGNMAITMLANSPVGEPQWQEGVAFLVSAYEDAKMFFAEAPPDAKHMLCILNWYIILDIAIHGPELSPNLQELEVAKQKIEWASQFAEFIGSPPRKTQLRLTRELILRLYPTATRDWADFITRLDGMSSFTEREQEKSTEIAEDTLSAWLNDLEHEEGEEGGCGAHHHGPYKAPSVSRSHVELYRCTHCGNPSAILRKCGGCGKTRYCDSSCQKMHWPEHKKSCKTSPTSST